MKRSLRPLVLAFAALLAAAPQDREAKGSITKVKTTMEIVDTLAIWNPAKKKLVILWLPTKLDKDDPERLQKKSAFSVLSRKASPDGDKWKNWYPYGQATMFLDEKSQGKDAVQGLTFYAYGMTKEGDNDNLAMDGQNARKVLKSFSFTWDESSKMGTFELSTAGSDKVGGESIGWDIRSKGPVLPLVEK